MAWILITNNEVWEYDNDPADPGADSPNSDGQKVYTKVRKVGSNPVGSNGTMGEISKTFWDAQ